MSTVTGRTGQRLEVRINQYIPANISKGNFNNLYRLINTSGSAMTEHLLNSHHWAKYMFSVLRKAHSAI